MARKIRFFLIGLIPGLALMFFIFSMKGAKCSGYLPNSRVIAETLSKKFNYSEKFQTEMQKNNVDEKKLRDSIIGFGEIDFDKSKAQQVPCPEYLLNYPKDHPKFQITFEKCDSTATFKTFNVLR